MMWGGDYDAQALAEQRGLVRNITFEDFNMVGVRGNAIDIDAYGQGHGGRETPNWRDTISTPHLPTGFSAGGSSRAVVDPGPVPCAAGTPPAPLPGSCMVLQRVLIRRVRGDADKAGQILCGRDCDIRMEDVHISANASACCHRVNNINEFMRSID